MSPAIDILAQVPVVASNWPTAVATIGVLVVGLIANHLAQVYRDQRAMRERAELRADMEAARKAVEVTSKTIQATATKVEDTALRVGKMGEVLDDTGRRIDGRLSELLVTATAKAHAEGVIAGTQNEQIRMSVPPGPTIVPVQIVNPEPIPVTPVGQRLEEIRGEQPK